MMVYLQWLDRRCPHRSSPDSRGSISKRSDSYLPEEKVTTYQIGFNSNISTSTTKEMLNNLSVNW